VQDERDPAEGRSEPERQRHVATEPDDDVDPAPAQEYEAPEEGDERDRGRRDERGGGSAVPSLRLHADELDTRLACETGLEAVGHSDESDLAMLFASDVLGHRQCRIDVAGRPSAAHQYAHSRFPPYRRQADARGHEPGRVRGSWQG